MWEVSKSKAERQRKIRALIATNDKAVLRAVVAIYQRQTESEKCDFTTKNENGIGFSAFDAGLMSSIAQQIVSGRNLTPKQFDVARRRIIRYARQLADIAEEHERLREMKTQPALELV